jgi:hypothetical protein
MSGLRRRNADYATQERCQSSATGRIFAQSSEREAAFRVFGRSAPPDGYKSSAGGPIQTCPAAPGRIGSSSTTAPSGSTVVGCASAGEWAFERSAKRAVESQ